MNLDYEGLEFHELSALNEFVVHLPTKISPIVEEHLINLQNASVAGQINTLKKLIECLRTEVPDSFDEYIGYAAFTAAISLIKNPKLEMDKRLLVLHSFGSRVATDHWNDDLIKMSIIAQTIWKACASKLDNVRRVATIISCETHFLRVTSILLMSAAMNATLADDDQPSVNVFCMYELSQLVQILNQLNTIDDLSKRLKKVHQFLAIYSLYQSLVYLRKPSNDVNQSLKPYYTSPVSDLLEMQKLMKNLSVELNILIRKNQQADFLALTELVDFVIMSGLEELPLANAQ